jgi:hypothetical protein
LPVAIICHLSQHHNDRNGVRRLRTQCRGCKQNFLGEGMKQWSCCLCCLFGYLTNVLIYFLVCGLSPSLGSSPTVTSRQKETAGQLGQLCGEAALGIGGLASWLASTHCGSSHRDNQRLWTSPKSRVERGKNKPLLRPRETALNSAFEMVIQPLLWAKQGNWLIPHPLLHTVHCCCTSIHNYSQMPSNTELWHLAEMQDL